MPADRLQKENDIEELVSPYEGTPFVNMASPMQDTVVSSTVTNIHSPFYAIENNLQCDSIQELSATDCINSHVYLKNNHGKTNSMHHIQDCCSWLSDFSKAMCQLAGSTNYQLFKRLLTIYAKNITKDAFIWDSKLFKLATLKQHISNVLLYYHLYWHDCKERVGDHYFYLQKISDILITYVNLELKLFNSSITSINKMSNILLNTLYIYLGNSEEHIFKVLLKSKLAIKQNNKICAPIFEKCFSHVAANKMQLTSVMYVRYILALKLWKSISDNQEEIKRINSLALDVIGSTAPSLCFDILHFFPEPPKKCINTTIWYLQTSFDMTTTIENFLKYEETLHGLTISNKLDINESNKNCFHLQINEDIALENVKKHIKLQNKHYMRRKKKLKAGEITFIDLTEEDDHKNEQKNIKIKQNLQWLKTIKKKKTLLQYTENIHKIKIANNTESCKSLVNNLVFTSLPISDNKVTESYNFDIVDSSCKNCDIYRCNDISILNNSNDIFENSDITKDKINQNNETSKICSISSDLFDDYICDMSIDSNLLSNNGSSHLTETKLLSSDFNTDSRKELIPSLLDFNPNGIDSLSNDFSYSSIDAIDPCLTRKNFKDTCLLNDNDKSYNTSFRKDSLLMTFRDSKNQLLTELTDFGLYEDEDKSSLIFNDESLITSSDTSSNPFILGLNSDITICDYSKSSLMDEYGLNSDGKEYPISFVDFKHWKKKILKTSTIRNGKEKIVIQEELDDDIFETRKRPEKRKRKRRAEKTSTLKIKESSSPKMKTSDSFTLDNDNINVAPLSPESKLEGGSNSLSNGLDDESSDKVISKFLTKKISFQNQQLHEFTKISNFQNLADYIKGNNINKIITLFDSGSSTLKKLKSKSIKSSTSCYFIRLLCEKGFLLRHYTENMEELEKIVGILPEKFICYLQKGTTPESLSSQVKCDISEANLIIYFTNSLSSVFKWLKGKCPKLFIIQEKTVDVDDTFITDYLNLIPIPSKDLQFDSNTKFELIQTETHDKGCQMLVDKLGWSVTI